MSDPIKKKQIAIGIKIFPLGGAASKKKSSDAMDDNGRVV